jgi:antirestriction protein ArdC
MEPKKPFHEVVAEKLIEQLKAGTAPWQKPWEPGEPNAYLPMNPTTGKRYKGINAIHLMAQGRSDARWMTYKQAAAVGAVRKGEKGTPVQYWKFSEEQNKVDDSGRPVLDAKGEPVKETVSSNARACSSPRCSTPSRSTACRRSRRRNRPGTPSSAPSTS